MKSCFAVLITLSFSSCNSGKNATSHQPGKISPTHAAAHQVIDAWHIAAAKADATAFFAAMSENSIYIGTDATERWTKSEFVAFAKPYFDRGKAWDFKPYDRNLHVTSDGKHAWFSELLTTWMGVCRGSGVLTYTKSGWKIDQYHLSVTVPNDLIKDFITLVNDFNNRKK
ncbi:MAG TPA: nuclear transport factor 2 family protein [Chryseosolibacter sp.]|nr:nuclear transport factor 2 family protein [Chryseosolibacter sp.]